MEKVYRNKLPKNTEVLGVCTRVENGEIVFEVNLKKVFQPQFGDIVRIEHPDCNSYKRNYVIGIFPDKKIPNKDTDNFFNIAFIDMEGDLYTNDGAAFYNYGHVHFATEEEKQELFNKLKEVGKQWNPDTKKLEDLRWKPKDGDMYYFVDLDCSIAYTRFSNSSLIDSKRVKANNCFKVEENAQKVADQMKKLFKNSKAE